MNLDFNFLSRSIGKTLSFTANFKFTDNSTFTDMFYAILREVNVEDNFIIVEQYFVEADANYKNEELKSIKRKLIKGLFTINEGMPLKA